MSDCRKLWSDQTANQAAGNEREPKREAYDCRIYTAPARSSRKEAGKRRTEVGKRNRKTQNGSRAFVKFSVRDWKEVKLKYHVIERFRGKYRIEDMCRIFSVSRIGYYAWCRRQGKTPKDQWLADMIVECQQKCSQTCGFRRVRLWLQRFKGETVNKKAILRVMRKWNLLSQIRRRRKYMQYQQVIHKYPNLLQRAFEQLIPNKFWATDITYIPTPQGMLYMCAVLDLCRKMVLAYRIGGDMTSSLVAQIVQDAICKERR